MGALDRRLERLVDLEGGRVGRRDLLPACVEALQLAELAQPDGGRDVGEVVL